MKYFKIFQ